MVFILKTEASVCCNLKPLLSIFFSEQVEQIFRKSVEFCSESDIWKLNVAHVLFMQENKFKDAAGFYEPIVKKHYDNVSFTTFCKQNYSKCLINFCHFVIPKLFCLTPNLFINLLDIRKRKNGCGKHFKSFLPICFMHCLKTTTLKENVLGFQRERIGVPKYPNFLSKETIN